MSKTTARTFIAAFLLLAAAVLAGVYGSSRIMTDEQSPFIIYDGYDESLVTWESLTQVAGLLAIAVSIAGALLWERETRPQVKQASILGLNETAASRMVRAAATQQTIVTAKAHTVEMSAAIYEEESLTPLERVIRGY
jgi:hypothetical protein